MKGKLIVIEGTDGAGKETQTNMLSKALCDEGVNLKELHFPCYGTTACGPVEMYLRGDFGKKAEDVNPYTASTMYAIDRFASMKTDWGKFYEDGGLLLSDRYTTSNVVLQGGKLQEPQKTEYLTWLYDLEYNKMGLPVPDMVFYINMPPEVTHKRLTIRSGKDGVQHDIHETDIAYLASCNNSALELARKSGWIIIQAATADGEVRTREDIHAEILGIVHQFLTSN